MRVSDVSRDHKVRTDIEVLFDLSYPIGPAALALGVLHGCQLFTRRLGTALSARGVLRRCADDQPHAALRPEQRPVSLAL